MSMHTERKQKILNKATEILEKHPLDAAHNLFHHERVLRLGLEIIEMLPEKLKKMIDLEVFEIATMWHDVILPPDYGVEKSEYLSGQLKDNGYPEKAIKKILEIIDTHEFWDRPKLIEAKVLYDADKLDALNIERGKRIVEAINRRDFSEKKKNVYVRVGKFWLKFMRSRLHFDYTRNLYDERLDGLLSDPEVEKLAKEIDVDFDEVREIATSEPNLIERVIFNVISLYRSF